MLKLYLIRHGECEMNLNLAERIGGRSNSSPLTNRGKLQSEHLAKHLTQFISRQSISPSDIKFFSSSATRSLETAKAVLRHLDIDQTQHLVVSDSLLEQHMGEWEGALRSECYTPENLALITADTHNFKSPNGESQKDVELRMIQYITDTVLPNTKPGVPSFIFGHGMAFKTVLRYILDSDPRMTRKFALANTSVTEIGFVESQLGNSGSMQPGWHILRVNDTSHLPHDLPR